MRNKSSQWSILLSPFGIIALGYLTAKIAGHVLGVWAWIPVKLEAFGLYALFIYIGGGKPSIKRWARSPQGLWVWTALALVVGLMPLPIFLSNWKVLNSIWIWLPWLFFAPINAFFEEGYWRGVLLDTTSGWSSWLCVLYSSILFALHHPFTLGVNSIANHHPFLFFSTFIMGSVWAIVYRKTGSLRWPFFAHILVDLLNLSILAFMNIYIPPSLPGR
jgi:membrane protease YdiL (CAAX protease family)